MNRTLLYSGNFVDLEVYGLKKSLRLPFCVKTTEKGIDVNRRLDNIQGNLTDLLITHTYGCPIYDH